MTSIHSFKVDMLIHVIAEDEQTARAHLDQHGGYVSECDVELVKTIEIAPSKTLGLVEPNGAPTLTVVE